MRRPIALILIFALLYVPMISFVGCSNNPTDPSVEREQSESFAKEVERPPAVIPDDPDLPRYKILRLSEAEAQALTNEAFANSLVQNLLDQFTGDYIYRADYRIGGKKYDTWTGETVAEFVTLDFMNPSDSLNSRHFGYVREGSEVRVFVGQLDQTLESGDYGVPPPNAEPVLTCDEGVLWVTQLYPTDGKDSFWTCFLVGAIGGCVAAAMHCFFYAKYGEFLDCFEDKCTFIILVSFLVCYFGD